MQRLGMIAGLLGLLCACQAVATSESAGGSPPDAGSGPGETGSGEPDSGVPDDEPAPLTFKVMTMNIGTDKDASYGNPGPTGYGDDDAEVTAEYYGNGLSWNVAEDALTAFLADRKPAVVVFQEGFYDGWCQSIPDLGSKFVCDGYSEDRPLQIERLLGSDYQVACARDEPDNCAGVRKDFATIAGCPLDEPCMDGLDGPDAPDGCSNGARVGGMTLDLKAGGQLRVVNVHGKSGADLGDMLCRVTHFEQIFEDGGDGQPIASGSVNLVMGDINTDPFLVDFEPSASYWNDWVGDGKPYSYMSSGEDDDGPATYAGGLRIDHIVSDHLLSKGCTVPGAGGTPPILEDQFWDHKPVICEVELAP